MFWNANNLYGWVMSQHLPSVKFEWYATNHIEEECILPIRDHSEIEYIFEVDLQYP